MRTAHVPSESPHGLIQLPHLPAEFTTPVLPPTPEQPHPLGPSELPAPPCFLEQVTALAEQRLPNSEYTVLLLHRANALLQDAVEAACVCIRAHIDPPMLMKHLLGSDHPQIGGAGEESAGPAAASSTSDAMTPSVADWSSAVGDHVGQVQRCEHLRLMSSTPHFPAMMSRSPKSLACKLHAQPHTRDWTCTLQIGCAR